ncbi:hypothetical protein MLD38_018812 [Melastoma candidum]|uniref:Uncharacterized protein n=1 Tax=Melastoma candidum TaxID=119954 RepID=A0ACB9QYG3_9MYRT|nr:hypothetical protein MLD38_018812 [Melastoma candidum]
MARTMLLESEVAKNLWVEAVSTACYISNRVHLRSSLGKTPYELYKGWKPNISYFHPFGSNCFILRSIKDGVGKFDARSDEGTFSGYSLTSKAYRVFNNRTLTVEESINVKVDDSPTQKEDAAEAAAQSSTTVSNETSQQTVADPNRNTVVDVQQVPAAHTENVSGGFQDIQNRGSCSSFI